MDNSERKKIIGYTAGVYDMFHVGHLNILRKAKELCDYLIVGVNSDEATYKYKKKYPIIPQKERMEIVEAIRYVDRVVSVDNTDKIYAFEKYKYDIIFVGNDHESEAVWHEIDIHLREYGARVLYIPYTEHISSSKLSVVISKLLFSSE